MGMKSDRDYVDVRVVKHLAFGLYVKLNNGQPGIVRVRELSWEKDKSSHWKRNYPIGWKGKAFRLPNKEGHLQEFSIRLTEDDPWDDISEKTDVNRIFEGVVTGVVEYGAFIEIAPGVTGLLHQSHLPGWAKGSPIDIFWPGDRVKVIAREIIRKERKISLGLPPLSNPPETGENARHVENLNGSDGTPRDLDTFLDADAPRMHLLVVEDEPEQSMAVSNWLRRLGQRVDVVDSAEQALDFLERSQPDLALIDVGLPKMDGAKLAVIILEKWPQVHVVSTTDWARADDMMDELDALQERGAELLIKPILPEDLIILLKKPAPDSTESKDETRLLTLENVPALKPGNSLHSLLQRCRKQLGFDLAILFALDPAHRVTSVVERSGESILDKNVIPLLVYSPVRDVAEDHEEVVVNEIQPADRNRFRYLLEVAPLTASCIGVPVPIRTQLDYALFVFDKRPRQITKEQKMYVDAMALAIAAWLEQNKFKEQSALIQRTALIGHLTRAMVHEINNLVGPLSSRLDDLQASIDRLEKKKDQASVQDARTRLISNALDDIQKNFKKIVHTTRMFRRVVAKGKNEILRVDEIVQETMDLLHDSGDRSHIKLAFVPPPQLVIVRNQAASLEQVLLNVMLNAVQQISELRPDSGGWVQVKIEQNCDSSNNGSLRILVEDNGPGIHASLKEKIFEAGYSTRHDGSGIGLYISRNLINDMGGKIYVKESSMLGGTIFAVEIPCQL